MKILLVNKFLYPHGGAETYIFRLGEQLCAMGHEVQYFGMDHEKRCVGNSADSYTSNMDFHGGSKLKKLTYPFRIIYSVEARKKIRLVLDDFQPDVVHLNNFNYQLTPSVILETVKWREDTGNSCRIVATAHDFSLVCPNHMLNDPITHENCEKCLNGDYINCFKGRCIHGSYARSLLGSAESYFWKRNGVYRNIDKIICCSGFTKEKMDSDPVLRERTVVLHNFIERTEWKSAEKKDYVLYFGRYSHEKGIETLLEACRSLPEIPFVFAGAGPMEKEVNSAANVRNLGFLTGKDLEMVVREAQFSVCPSEVYENCPFSVLESQTYGTPVLGADHGGIPELIRNGETGELFEARNAEDLTVKIRNLWNNKALLQKYSSNCRYLSFDTVETYCEKLMEYYR
ncbi:MAG: glycosyltransferase family 4 protein [Oscillospiraceae bacterium]|nr:glycosyltransferase family 4 protein [Oscillospiraceae bacterium]